MTKISKIFNTVIMALLIMAMGIVFSGCSASQEEVANIMVKAGAKYFDNHTDYSKFADTTFTLKTSNNEDVVQEFEFKKKAEDTETVKENRTLKNQNTTTTTISFQTVEDIVYFKLAILDVSISNGFEVDENALLKSTSTTTTTTTTFVASPIITAGQGDEPASIDGYYMSKEISTKVDNENADATKEYYEYATLIDYQQAINALILKANQLVARSYFGFTELMYMGIGNYYKGFGGAGVEIKISMPMLTEGSIQLIKMVGNIGFRGDNLGKVNAEINFIGPNDYKNTITSNLIVENSAKTITLPDILGAESEFTQTATAFEFDDDIFPTNALNIFRV